MINRPFIIAAGLALCAGTVAAQQTPAVRGVVRDSAGGTPVPGAVVRLIGTHREDPTEPDGSFEFLAVAPGSYTVQVRSIGFRPASRRITVATGDVALAFELVATSIELAPTVVTGTLSERSSDDALSSITVLSDAELDRRRAATIGATLETQPGLALSSLGPATARPVIRGLSGDRIVMLEDGQRPGDMSSTNPDHAISSDPVTAERVEVVRGPMSLLYGSSALGGVVNMIREEIPEALPEHTRGELSVEGTAGTPGGVAGGWLGTRLGGVAVRGEGSVRRTGDARTPDGPIAGTDATVISTSVGAGLVGAHSHGGLSWRYYNNDYGVPGGFVGGHQTDVSIRMWRNSLRGEGEWHRAGPLSRLRATSTFTRYYHEELEPSGHLGTSYDLLMGTGELQAAFGENGTRPATVGVRAQYRDVATGGTLHTPSTYDWTAAAYAVEEFVLGRVRLQAGARYDLSRYVPRDSATVTAGGEQIPVRPRSFGSLSGSFGALVAASEAWRFGASIARAYRTPDFNELYSDGPHLAANTYDVGDPRLREETGLGGEVFSRWTTTRAHLEVAAFINVLDDYIFPSSRGRAELGSQGNRPRFQFSNADARFAGVEGSLSLRVTHRVVLEATASHVAARFTSHRDSIPVITSTDTTFVPASVYPPLIPPPHGRVGLRWESSRWFAEAGVRWSAAQNRLGDFETRTPGYAAGDASVGVRILAGHGFHAVTLRVTNLTNAAYRDHLDRLKEIQLQPGRLIGLLYRLSL